MIERIRSSYEHTIYASYIGYITQAIIVNFIPLLFLTLASEYELTLDKITLLTTTNFAVQFCVDFLSAKYIDKIGYRKAIILAHICSAVGLVGLAILPTFSQVVLGSAYVGILMSVVIYAIGGGIIEVLISPIVEACPTKKKEAAMSLLHSFYCWGHVAVVLLSTLFFCFAGIENWKWMAVIWAIVPICNIIYFSLVPIYPITGGHEALSMKGLLKQKVFWLLIVLMICAGASEQAISQWVSTFAESALRMSKTVGDLAGNCVFAICMGTARALYGKYSDFIPLKKMMAGSAFLCILCYFVTIFSKNPYMALVACGLCGFSVGIFWPGTFSVGAVKIPMGGTAMYAFMALSGDVGCFMGPSVVGFVADATGGNLKTGLNVAMIFPIIMMVGICCMKMNTSTKFDNAMCK